MLQILLILFFPYLSQILTRKLQVEKWLSPVVLCYGVGILLASTHVLEINADVSHTFTEATILFAIPLLLYSTDILGWLKYARSTIFGFVLCILSGLICCLFAGWYFYGQVEDTWRISAMLTGLYTGGIANLQAIGLALEASEETIILLNAADIITGGVLLLWLTSIAHGVLGLFLPKFENTGTMQEDADFTFSFSKKQIPNMLKALGLTVLIVGLAVGITFLITGALKSVALIILLLTTFSILASLSPTIRQWEGAFEMGNYFLLMFCVAIGLLADFSSILAGSLTLVIYTAVVLMATVLLHYFLCWCFKIDRDTTIITATAALYGPVFIGQVASAIGNKRLIFSGMATGLVGYAVGNYLGIGLGYLLRSWLGS